jgi:hypothetical protein
LLIAFDDANIAEHNVYILYCVGKTVYIKSSQFCKPYHCEAHSVK